MATDPKDLGPDSLYRREEDRKWRESIETRTVSLTSSQKVTDDELDDLQIQLEEFRVEIEGDPKRRDPGLIGQVNAIETSLNSVQRVLQPDATGNSGLIAEFRKLKNTVQFGERRSEYRWKFWAAIGAAALLLVREVIHDLPQIKTFLNSPAEDALGRIVEHAKHPKARYHHYKAPAPLPVEETESENPQ